MNRTTLIRSAVAGGCALAVTLGGVAPAFADTSATPAPTSTRAAHSPATLQQVQAKGEADIDKRLASISAAVTRVTAAKDASASDKQTILGRLSADQTGLTALRSKIAADTDLATARSDVRSIFTTYRVYAVVLSQSRIGLRADRLTGTTIARAQKAHDALAAKGADAAQLAAMQSDIDAAGSATSGLSASALAVTPSDFDTNHAVMTPLRSRLEQAVSSLRQALAIAKQLRGGHHKGTGAPSPSATASSGS